MKVKGSELEVGNELVGIGVIYMIVERSGTYRLFIRGTLPMFVGADQLMEIK